MAHEFIGKYRIVGELGRGAMGVVFRALDPAIDRHVAIKVIRTPAFSSQEETAQLRMRLMREARAAGRLSHPNIVTVHALEEHDDFLYVVMEYVEGQSLEQLIASGTLTDPSVAIPILRQTADALDYAHSKGIIHRDIKPGNVLIENGGRVKLTDFGIAKISSHTITETGMTMGTPAYMSPEQIRAEPLDGRADQYSLAVVAFEVLTGRLPFVAPTYDALVLKITTEKPPSGHEGNASLPRACSKGLLKALAKNPQSRYSTCVEFVDTLAGALVAKPSPRVVTIPGPQKISAQSQKDLKAAIAEKEAIAKSRREAADSFKAKYQNNPIWSVYQKHHMRAEQAALQAEADLRAAQARRMRSKAGAPQHNPSKEGNGIDSPETVLEIPGTAPYEQETFPEIPLQMDRRSETLRLNEVAPHRRARIEVGTKEVLGFLAVLLVGTLVIASRLVTSSKPARDEGATPAKTDDKPVTTRVNLRDGLAYVWIPPGTFQMGCSPRDNDCQSNEMPAHPVTITKGFWIGQTDVTVGAWKLYTIVTTKSMPSEPMFAQRSLNPQWSDDQQPMTMITWTEASAFCGWAGGRLPTEAEWEYAARAGSTVARYGDLEDIAWYWDNNGRDYSGSDKYSEDRKATLGANGTGPKPVGLKRPNAWKLYDMLGNVFQWTDDGFSNYLWSATDPHGPVSPDNRVMRGGSWYDGAAFDRVSYRDWRLPTVGYIDTGVRCAANNFR